MNELEKKTEAFIKSHLDGLWLKWVSPANAGVPDRIAVVHGRVYFVEMKQADGALSPIQKAQIERINKAGKAVHVVYGRVGAEAFLDWVNGGEYEGTETEIPGCMYTWGKTGYGFEVTR